jgi:hypothetical protein
MEFNAKHTSVLLLPFDGETLARPARFFEVAENVPPFLLRSPRWPLFRHCLQLIDPSYEVLCRLSGADLLISHVHTNRIRTSLRHAYVEQVGVGSLSIESGPGALIQSIAAVGVITCQRDRRSGPSAVTDRSDIHIEVSIGCVDTYARRLPSGEKTGSRCN